MADGRFEKLNEEKIAELLNDKDIKNTQKAMKGRCLIFEAYLQEKNSFASLQNVGCFLRLQFRMLKLNFTAKIIVCCELCILLQDSNQVHFVFFRAFEIF